MRKEEILRELDWIMNYRTPVVALDDPDNNIFLKKEDAIPFSFGGNKCRIAARYFMDLIEKDCDVVITYGATSSNMCRVVANMAARYGLKCVIVTPDEMAATTCNSEITELLGARRVKCPLDDVAGTIDRVVGEYRKTGNPYFIYGGGHGVLGTDSYRNVLQQIVDHEASCDMVFDYVFITLATGTSMSGLIAENEIRGCGKNIIGVSVAREYDRTYRIMSEALTAYDSRLSGALESGRYRILGDYRFGGHGRYSKDVIELIRYEMKSNGVNFDATYTGKAFFGMKDYLRRNNITGRNILFIHTGGTPLFFRDSCRYLNEIDG